MAISKYPNLPSLTQVLVGLGESGKWVSLPGLLGRLKTDIRYEGEVDPNVISAIPTPWARPLLYWDALRTEGHPCADAIQSEWRGALGLLALAENFGITLTSVPYTLSTDSRWPGVQALASLAPASANEWLRGYLISVAFQGSIPFPLILTSPFSLVYTPKEYTCPDFIPFRDSRGRLQDPLAYFRDLGVSSWQQELTALSIYIRNILQTLGDERVKLTAPGADKQILVTHLKNWLNEIEREIHEKNLPADAYESIHPVLGDLPYSSISQPIKINYSAFVTSGILSDFFLGTNVNLNNLPMKKRPLVVWDKGWRYLAQRRFINPHTTRTLRMPEGAKGDSLPDGTKYPWINPEKLFFTSKILQLTSSTLKEVYGKYTNGYLYPFKKEILKYFTPEEIVKYTTIRSDHTGGVEVELHLPLSDHNRNSKGLARIVKRYSPESIITQKALPPHQVLALWPNFASSSINSAWKEYYLYCRNVRTDRYKSGLTINPVWGNPDKHERKSWDLEPKANTAEGVKIFSLDSPPTGISFFSDPDEVGLLLIKPLPAAPESNRTWNVGFDFGTSNTSIYYLEGNEGFELSRPIRWGSRVIPILLGEQDIEFKFHACTEFFPTVEDSADEISSSPCFSSLFRVVRTTENPNPMEDGRALFADALDNFLEVYNLSETVIDRLKWERGTYWHYISTYLEHILLMLSAEAYAQGVRTINLKWAYPSAFSEKMRNNLARTWQNISTQLPKTTGVRLNVPGAPVTESVAIAQWKTADAPKPQVIVDIGGGTTDIAIWSNGKFLYQTSVLMAGGLLADFARRQDRFIDELLRGIGRSEFLSQFKVKEYFKQRPHSILNLIMKKFEEPIQNWLDRGGPAGGTAPGVTVIQEGLSFLFYAYSSIFYYIGLILEANCKESEEECDVYLAGNGSKLLMFINTKESILTSLSKIMQKSAPHIKGFQLFFSDCPKGEVAKGLLNRLISDSPQEHFIVGEDGYYIKTPDGTTKKVNRSDDLLSVKEAIKNRTLTLPSPPDFPQLTKFTDAYDGVTEDLDLAKYGKTLRSKKGEIQAFIQHRLNSISKQASEEDDNALYTPLFLEEVRGLLLRGVLNMDWGEIPE